jgi:hypothetical protein
MVVHAVAHLSISVDEGTESQQRPSRPIPQKLNDLVTERIFYYMSGKKKLPLISVFHCCWLLPVGWDLYTMSIIDLSIVRNAKLMESQRMGDPFSMATSF